ncbi:hypothetical protein AB0C33_20075 [Nonomuraea sp. NPDC048881]|uniref:hypothetical protein n=1 Tax=Nonomuraea sp. NPDC048881 TaxID=3155030 RepID=UPI0033DC78FD
MVWKTPTPTELQLQTWLNERGLPVSLARIRRWREFGALPWPQRRALGHGHGSVSSALAQDTYIVAEALALATKQKKQLEKVVLRVFFAHPRYEEPFIATRLPLSEDGVRKALEWAIVNDSRSAIVKIERAMVAAGTDGDPIGAAVDAAHQHFRSLLRQQSAARRRHIEVPRLIELRDSKDATALADMAVAALIPGALGSDTVNEAICDPINKIGFEYESNETLPCKTLDEAILALGREQELQGLSGQEIPNISTRAQIQALRAMDYDKVCIIRDLLVVLTEAALPLRIARKTLSDDPVNTRVMNLRTQYAIIDYCLHYADTASRAPAASAWKVLTPHLLLLLGSYGASDKKFNHLREIMITLDPVLDGIPSLIERIRTSHKSNK